MIPNVVTTELCTKYIKKKHQQINVGAIYLSFHTRIETTRASYATHKCRPYLITGFYSSLSLCVWNYSSFAPLHALDNSLTYNPAADFTFVVKEPAFIITTERNYTNWLNNHLIFTQPRAIKDVSVNNWVLKATLEKKRIPGNCVTYTEECNV